MRLVILGSGTLVLGQGHASAGLALQHGGRSWIFDLGRGVVTRMEQEGIDPLTLPSLHLTHWHPDHSCDLVPFLFSRNYTPQDRPAPLLITGPPGFAQFFSRLQVPWPWLKPRFECEVRDVVDQPFDAGPAQLTPIPLFHGDMPNVGYRITVEGTTVAYTGDTGPCDQLLSLASGVDILVAECSLPDEHAVDSHLSPTSLGKVARQAGCKALVVTHLYPQLAPEVALAGLSREFDGEIVLARDGWTRDV